MATNNIGTITQVIGAVVDVKFEGELPSDPQCAAARKPGQAPRARGGAASGREHGAHHRHGHHRRAGARRRGRRYRRADPRAGGAGDAGPHPQRHRRAGGRARPDRHQDHVADPPAGAGIHRPVDRGRDPRHRHQGRRSAGALCARRQGRSLRRRRRRQDRHHHGAHQQHRQGAWRLFGVRRRRRAHARGQRPLSRDDRIRRSSSRTGRARRRRSSMAR